MAGALTLAPIAPRAYTGGKATGNKVLNMKINLKDKEEPGYIKAGRVQIMTDSGVWHVGVDNYGNVYIASDIGGMSILPSASNRVIIERDA